MEKFLKPDKFDVDPHSPTASQEWTYWFKTFENFTATFPGTDDVSKLKVLTNLVSHSVYQLMADKQTYTEAISALKNVYVKPVNEIFARHQLATRKQSLDETIDKYHQALEVLSKTCDFQAVDAETHRKTYVRDAFIRGITSQDIRLRLLEFNKLTLDEAVEKARALESAKTQSATYMNLNEANLNAALSAPQESPRESVQESPELAAIRRNQQNQERKCFFCGLSRHRSRQQCPALEDDCRNCKKKGHWAAMCQSPQSLKKHLDSKSKSAALVAATSSLDRAIVDIQVNNVPTQALLDTGSSETFISKQFAESCRFKLYPTTGSVAMASTSYHTQISNYCLAKLNFLGHQYNNVKLTVLPDLCATVIVGHDLLKQHSELSFSFGGPKPPITVSYLAPAKIEPPPLFEYLSGNVKPIITKTRKYSEEDREFMKKEIDKLLEDKIIEESRSPWRAQAFVVKNENHKKRMVIDYSQTINRYTHLDAYPIPDLEYIVSQVSKNSYFSTIDFRSAYHQVPLREKDRPYTAFEACGRLYQFRRLAFGLTDGVPTFQRVIDDVICKEKLENTYAYLDDVTVCGKTQDEHDRNLKRFMDAVTKYGFTINQEKSKYSLRSITLLGYKIENNTKSPDPERLKPLLELPIPTTPKELQRLIGMFAHYSKWVPNYSDKVRLLLETKSFPLSQEAVSDFENIKTEISNSVVKTIDSKEPFTVETDASDYAISAVLSQSGRPVAFFSQKLSHSELDHPPVEKEAYAIVGALRKWRHYLMGRHFRIITDQRSVAFMFTNHKSKIKNEKIHRWRLELSCYSYEILYRPGKENQVADTLSRNCSSIQSNKLYSLHCDLCHPGVTRMVHWVRTHNLPYSVEEVRRMTATCLSCNVVKPKFLKNQNARLIKATHPLERLSMDFKGPLPSRSRNKYLLTIVDEFSRFPFAYPCPDTSSSTVIDCLVNLFTMFGVPAYIHTDRGSSFTSRELQDFLHTRGVATSMSTPYNPAGNGQIERENGTIWKTVSLTLKHRNLDVKDWEDVLPDSLHSIRSLLCTATNETPHERMFKHHRRSANGCSLPSWLVPSSKILMKKMVRQSKYDPLVEEVELLDANPQYARVRLGDGRETTVSLKHLAPNGEATPEPAGNPSQEDPEPPIPEEFPMSASPNPDPPAVPAPVPLRRSSRDRRIPERLKDYELNF